MNDEQGILRRLDHYADCIEKGVHVTGSQLKSLVKDIRESGLVLSQSPPAEAQPVGVEGFRDWVIEQMPAGTVIDNPELWAERLARAYALNVPAPPSAPVGVEVDAMLRDAERYRALVASGKFAPSFNSGWALATGTYRATKGELDAAADALVAQQGGGSDE